MNFKGTMFIENLLFHTLPNLTFTPFSHASYINIFMKHPSSVCVVESTRRVANVNRMIIWKRKKFVLQSENIKKFKVRFKRFNVIKVSWKNIKYWHIVLWREMLTTCAVVDFFLFQIRVSWRKICALEKKGENTGEG